MVQPRPISVNGSARPFVFPADRAWFSGARRMALLAIAFAGLTAVGAQVRVPLPWTDVPMTLQGLAVLLSGMFLPPVAAALAMLLYVAAGLAGLPVFAAGSAGVFGPTGGYILGFVVGACMIAVLRGRRRSGPVRLALAGCAGMACVLGLGVAWRTLFFGGNLPWAVSSGLVPFLPKAFVEVLLATVIAVNLRPRTRRPTGE